MNKLISGAYGFEIALNNTNKIFLPDISILRNKRIKYIDVIDSFLSHTANGNSIINVNTPKYITLVEQNTQQEIIQNLPTTFLNPFKSNITVSDRIFINKIIDFSKSYIDVSKTDPDLLAGKYIYIVVYFDEPRIWNVLLPNSRTRTYSLELNLEKEKNYFSENLNLFDKKYRHLQLSTPVTTPSGNEGIDRYYLKNKFITLSRDNIQFIHRVPLVLFQHPHFSENMRLQNVKVDLQHSYIETTTTTSVDLKSLFFNVVVDDNK